MWCCFPNSFLPMCNLTRKAPLESQKKKKKKQNKTKQHKTKTKLKAIDEHLGGFQFKPNGQYT